MKKLLIAFISTMLFAGMATAQDTTPVVPKNKSNGTIEILALYIPDFVVFKPATGQTFKKWEVWLVSSDNENSHQAFKLNTLRVDVNVKKMEASCTDKSEVRALFNIKDNSFEPQKIKFVINGKDMYYCLDTDTWE